MRRASLLLLALVACGPSQPKGASVPLLPVLRQALLENRIADASATLDIRGADGSVFVSNQPVAADLDNGFILQFDGVPPGTYTFLVTVSSTLSTAEVPVPILTYRQDNVVLSAGATAVTGVGRWELPALEVGSTDYDGDGISNFGELVSGLDPAQRWSRIATPPNGEQVIGIGNADMRALFMVTNAQLYALGDQHRTELASLTGSISFKSFTPSSTGSIYAGAGACASAAIHSVSNPVCGRDAVGCGFMLGGTGGCILDAHLAMPQDSANAPGSWSRDWYYSWWIDSGARYETSTWVRIARDVTPTSPLGFMVVDGSNTPYAERWWTYAPPSPTVTGSAVEFAKDPGYAGDEPGLVALIPPGRCSAQVDPQVGIAIHVLGNGLGLTPLAAPSERPVSHWGMSSGSCWASVDPGDNVTIRAVFVPQYSDSCELYLVYDHGMDPKLTTVRHATLTGADCSSTPALALGPAMADQAIGTVTAAYYGRAQLLADGSSFRDSYAIVGTQDGHVYALGPQNQLLNGPSAAWSDLGAVPGGGPVLGVVTDWRGANGEPGNPTYPEGVIWPIFVATPTGIYRAP